MIRPFLCALPLLISFSFIGCGDDSGGDGGHGGEHTDGEGGNGGEHTDGEGGNGGESGEDQCCVLGAMCHVVGDDVDPEVEACHQLGHEDVASACAEKFEYCKALCASVTDHPVEHACD